MWGCEDQLQWSYVYTTTVLTLRHALDSAKPLTVTSLGRAARLCNEMVFTRTVQFGPGTVSRKSSGNETSWEKKRD